MPSQVPKFLVIVNLAQVEVSAARSIKGARSLIFNPSPTMRTHLIACKIGVSNARRLASPGVGRSAHSAQGSERHRACHLATRTRSVKPVKFGRAFWGLSSSIRSPTSCNFSECRGGWTSRQARPALTKSTTRMDVRRSRGHRDAGQRHLRPTITRVGLEHRAGREV